MPEETLQTILGDALAGKFDGADEPHPRYLLMHEAQIRCNWHLILIDRNNPQPDITDVEEWIALARGGGMKALGAEIVIQNMLAEGYKSADAAVRSGWKGAEEI